MEKDKSDEVEIENSAEEKTEENEVSKEEELQQQIAQLKDTLVRKVADSENLRKRLEREKTDAVKFANTSLVKDLLPTIDNFEHITASMSNDKKIDESVQAIFDGIVLCEKAMQKILQKHGIEKVEAKSGDDFDHRYHQAMCEVESEEIAPGKIVSVMQNGYVYHDRLLRPAMVSVAKKK